MINWIIGGIIFALVALIAIRAAVRLKNGKSCCSGCREGNCGNSKGCNSCK